MMPTEEQPQYNYHQALMRRLSMINDLGSSQTYLQRAQQPTQQPSISLPSTTNNRRGVGGIEAFISAIAGQESGNNYGAVNRDSGAMGKYQIMPGNLGGNRSGWDYEALGRDISPGQFIKSPQLQEAIAQFKLKQYYQKWGPAGAAVAWYAGPGTVGGYLKNPNKYTNPQGAYPSIASYVNSILSRL